MLTIPSTDTLTLAEAKVLALVEAGHSNQMIAARLAIMIGMVKSHLHRVYEKLEARNRLDAISKARMRGYSPIPMETLGVSDHVIGSQTDIAQRARSRGASSLQLRVEQSGIGDQLAVTVGTIKGHLVRIYRKLNLRNRTGAVAKARQMGLLK